MLDYSDYFQIDLEEHDVDGGSHNSIEEILQGLDEEREMVEQILEDQIDEVENEIENVEAVYEENASKLWETIRSETERLEVAESGAGEDEREVRDRLARLYQELRRERREEIENRLELKMRKWELERELEELSGSKINEI